MLKTQEIYPYAFGDRLSEDRNTYFYTKYHGRKTFSAWQQVRKMESTDNCLVNDPKELFNFEITTGESVYIQTLKGGNEIITNGLLDYVYIAIDEEILQCEAIFWLKKLTKKFEVCKRIHKSYYELRFLAVDNEQHRDIWLYLKLAALLAKGYDSYRELPYLNVFIKVLDSICSQENKLDDKMKRYIAHLIQSEKVFVEEIAKQMKVSIYE